MQNEDTGKVAETKVQSNNDTSLPAPLRTNENIEPGDTIEWYHETCETGDRWLVRKKPTDDTDSHGEGN